MLICSSQTIQGLFTACRMPAPHPLVVEIRFNSPARSPLRRLTVHHWVLLAPATLAPGFGHVVPF